MAIGRVRGLEQNSRPGYSNHIVIQGTEQDSATLERETFMVLG
jgi:hypothetical protein